jgi:metal-responsive CopG/Arc/MetJ family transcriptional regulator
MTMSKSKKFTISMPDGLVEEIDAFADVSGATRSGILREAMAEYIATRRRQESAEEREARWREIDALMEHARSAPDLCPGESAIETLHRLRDERERRILGEDDDA